jgi:hypothetical protein
MLPELVVTVPLPEIGEELVFVEVLTVGKIPLNEDREVEKTKT